MNDQWASRAITKNTNINLTAEAGVFSFFDSVQDMYYNLTFGNDSSNLPDSLSVTNFPPELNYYLVEKLRLLDSEIAFDDPQIKLLFGYDISNPQSLMQPVNLHYFYEKYKLGEIEDIIDRFSVY